MVILSHHVTQFILCLCYYYTSSLTSLKFMCFNPITIPNPNYKRPYVRDSPSFLRFVDRESPTIDVNCGHCFQCVALKQMYYCQRILMESINNHLFMLTLTYDNEHLPSVVTVDNSGNEWKFNYADFRHPILMFKRIVKWNLLPYKYRYFGVSERGSEKHRPHFHFIILVPKQVALTFDYIMNVEHQLYDVFRSNWCVRKGTIRKPIYEPLFQYHERWLHGKLYRNYDLQYVNPAQSVNGVSDCAYYVLKYLLKENDYEKRLKGALFTNYDELEAKDTWNLIRSKYFYSTFFGLNGGLDPFRDSYYDSDIIDYLKDCINRSKNSNYDYPCFFSPITGDSFPLAPFYRKNTKGLLTYDDLLFFWKKGHPIGDESNFTFRNEDLYNSQYKTQFDSFVKKIDAVSSIDDFLDEL